MAEERRPRRPSLRIEPSDLALEIVSIVIAIVLATTAGQIVANHQADARTRESLAQIRQEVAHDDTELEGLRSLHHRVDTAFALAIRRTRGEYLTFDAFTHTFGDAAPTGFHPFDGSTTAWDLARGSSVLQDVPYGVRAALQTRYADLAHVRELSARLYERFLTAPTEDHPNFYFTAVAVSANLKDLVYAETALARDDESALHALSASGM
ncbi:MAG: hypothetical protein IAI48_02205 [Candidatus Eremiobacteraeota bacterium]|nr:hypothetical protein [Candidatus Eremiobacteraeota bacterium]